MDKIIKNGDILCDSIQVRNSTSDIIENVEINIDIPNGLSLIPFNPPKGWLIDNVWSIDMLLPGEAQVAYVCFTVVDSCGAPFRVNWTSGKVGNCEKVNEDACIIFDGISCCDIVNCGETVSDQIVLKSPDGNCWEVSISDTGEFVKNTISCP